MRLYPTVAFMDTPTTGHLFHADTNGRQTPARAPSAREERRAPRNYLRKSLIATRDETAAQCLRFVNRLRKSRTPVFTGLTALKLNAVEIPWCRSLNANDLHVLASAAGNRSHMNATHFMVWTHNTRQLQSITIEGQQIWFTDPIVTWAILAKHLSQTEIIVLADTIRKASLYDTPIRVRDFEEYLALNERFLGKNRCRDALSFLGLPLDSSMEMRCMLALLRHGLDPPQTGYPIYVETLQRTVHADLAYPDSRVVIEYDGDAHRWDKTQFRRDERTRQALRAMGYTVIVVFADTFSSNQRILDFAQEVARASGVPLTGQPQQPYIALLNDDLLAEDRLRQRRCRARRRRNGSR